jgi:hypothetical protein
MQTGSKQVCVARPDDLDETADVILMATQQEGIGQRINGDGDLGVQFNCFLEVGGQCNGVESLQEEPD